MYSIVHHTGSIVSRGILSSVCVDSCIALESWFAGWVSALSEACDESHISFELRFRMEFWVHFVLNSASYCNCDL